MLSRSQLCRLVWPRFRIDAVNRVVDRVDAATDARAAAASNTFVAVAGTAPANLRTRFFYDGDGLTVGVADPRAFTVSVTSPDLRYLTRVDYDQAARPRAQWVPYYDTGSVSTAPLYGANATASAECPVLTPTTTRRPVTVSGAPLWPATAATSVGVCVTRARYDQVGNLTRVTNPTADAVTANNPRFTELTYTDDNLLLTRTEAAAGTATGRVTHAAYTYDGAGRATTATAATGWRTGTTYSYDGLALEEDEGLDLAAPQRSRNITYDANSQPTLTDTVLSLARTDRDLTTYYADGATHRVVSEGAGEGDDVITAYGYDPSANPITVWSPAAVAATDDTNTSGTPTVNTFTFDNLLAATLDPVSADGSVRRRTTFGYDPAGRKTTETVAQVTGGPAFTVDDPAAVDVGDRRWGYADNGWMVADTARTGETITHAYTPTGQPASVTDGAGTTVTGGYFLNDWARETTATRPGGATVRTEFLHHGDGVELARLNYEGTTGTAPTLWNWASYTYDNARNHTGGITQFTTAGTTPVTDINWSRTYNPDGRLTGGTDAAGTSFTASVTPAGDLASIDLANGADRWAYTYDAMGRVGSRQRTGQAAESFVYDPHGRVTGWAGQSIGYDPNDAQASGLPGARGGVPLNRLTDAIKIATNRNESCADPYYPRGDLSCDEYPFASTYQGGRTMSGGGPRTFSWCNITLSEPASTGLAGYSVCMIPGPENSYAGTRLNQFNQDNRIIDRDAYYVRVVP